MRKKGFALVEIIISMAVFSTILFAVTRLFWVSQEAASLGKEKLKASSLALEYQEGLKNLQRSNWNLLVNGRYILQNISGDLTLVPTETAETFGRFSRYLTIGTVLRDQNGIIVSSGGTLDQSTKKITVNISWEGVHPGQMTYVFYLTRYFENFAWRQTTVNDFDAGEMDMVKIVSPVMENGEVQLKGGCFTGDPESLIYDDLLQNGWRTNCSGLPFWQWLICSLLQFFSNSTIVTNSTDYVYGGSGRSIKITLKPPSSGTAWSWVRIYNFNKVCTVGFKNLHFYAYNPSSSEVRIWTTAVYNQWDRREIVLTPNAWTELSLDYEQISESYENTLDSIFFSKQMSASSPNIIFYVDQMELTGGMGGYFSSGTLISPVLDTGKSSAFNRIGFNGDLPANTSIGFQTAVSNSSVGPWIFYGPGGTTSDQDVYLESQGSGLWLGANIGRYFRYKALLKSIDGENTPILKDVTVNYSP